MRDMKTKPWFGKMLDLTIKDVFYFIFRKKHPCLLRLNEYAWEKEDVALYLKLSSNRKELVEVNEELEDLLRPNIIFKNIYRYSRNNPRISCIKCDLYIIKEVETKKV